jgi:integrase
MTPRRRNPENKKLPERWRWYHGAYRYSVPRGDEHYFDGKKNFRLGKTLTEAYDEWARRLQAKKSAEDAAAIGAGMQPTEKALPHFIKEGLERYLLEVTPAKAVRSQANDRKTIPVLVQRFGHFPITGAGMPEPRHVYEYVSHRKNARTGKPARTAAHREMELLSHAYTKFIQWGCLNEHPFKRHVRLQGDLAIPRREGRYVEDWEIQEVLKLKPLRKYGSVKMCQAYIRLKLELKGLRMTDMLQLQPARHFTDAGILIAASKTSRSTGKKLLYRWTPERRAAVEAALNARPIDIAPWLFCTSTGDCYVSQEDTSASGFESVWQRFMERVVKETKVARFKERDIRAKVGSDAETVEEAQQMLGHADAGVTRRHYRRKPEIIK